MRAKWHDAQSSHHLTGSIDKMQYSKRTKADAYELMRNLTYQPEAKSRHSQVLSAMLDRSFEARDMGRLTARSLAEEIAVRCAISGASRSLGKTAIAGALKDLEHWGFIIRVEDGTPHGQVSPKWHATPAAEASILVEGGEPLEPRVKEASGAEGTISMGRRQAVIDAATMVDDCDVFLEVQLAFDSGSRIVPIPAPFYDWGGTFQQLLKAVGLNQVNDSSDLVGRALEFELDRKGNPTFYAIEEMSDAA